MRQEKLLLIRYHKVAMKKKLQYYSEIQYFLFFYFHHHLKLIRQIKRKHKKGSARISRILSGTIKLIKYCNQEVSGG